VYILQAVVVEAASMAVVLAQADLVAAAQRAGPMQQEQMVLLTQVAEEEAPVIQMAHLVATAAQEWSLSVIRLLIDTRRLQELM
jgi:translation elongation factor EF-Tu-like GTPase